jgi:hypothetical protein
MGDITFSEPNPKVPEFSGQFGHPDGVQTAQTGNWEHRAQ